MELMTINEGADKCHFFKRNDYGLISVGQII